MKSRINKCIKSSLENYTRILQDDVLQESIQKIVTESIVAFRGDKKMLLCGNGGSASDAQHIAAELSGRFYTDRPPLYAEALHVNSSYMTAVANDYGYEATYARMIEAAGRKGDVIIGISTSGNSPNVVKAMRKAKELEMLTIGFTGESGGKMKEICDIMICVPSDDTPRIQEAHILIGHIICQLIEEEMFPDA
ncbi:MAG: D-sedoheptulose 7-phosphate isomerase [Flavobacteriales bacterium]|jgi:D-sedoheptulose 7-phosphate isomerase|nr:D-sedoheptulose 7-phosphate isomerase [Flavobacteriales bacterium]|tara:strand:+ start:1175 stop:1756 length:582 start_codon:yes stop_codon:yes gene_type:complete